MNVYFHVFIWLFQVFQLFPSKQIAGFFMSVIISPFPVFLLLHDLQNILLVFFIEFVTKSWSSYFTLILSVCYLILSSESILIHNANFQSNFLLLPTTDSGILFASLCIIISAGSIFVISGIVALLFFGKNKWG